jgi:hypothetical protein
MESPKCWRKVRPGLAVHPPKIEVEKVVEFDFTGVSYDAQITQVGSVRARAWVIDVVKAEREEAKDTTASTANGMPPIERKAGEEDEEETHKEADDDGECGGKRTREINVVHRRVSRLYLCT